MRYFDTPERILARRVDVPAELVGIETPPCHIHMKFLPVGDRWTVLARSAPDKAVLMSRWLQGHNPTNITMGPGLAPKILRAEFERLPEAWSRLVSTVRTHHVDITPAGMVSIFIEGEADEIEHFIAQIQGVEATLPPPLPNAVTNARPRPLRPGQSQVRCRPVGVHQNKITPRQFDALSTAVALGYYEIPHRLDLRALAATMNISLGSVSELLRRGEAAVITNYVDSFATAPWTDTPEFAEPTFGGARRPAPLPTAFEALRP